METKQEKSVTIQELAARLRIVESELAEMRSQFGEEDDPELTEDIRESVREAMRDHENGETVTLEELKKELNL